MSLTFRRAYSTGWLFVLLFGLLRPVFASTDTLSVGQSAGDPDQQTVFRSAAADILYQYPLPISNWRETLASQVSPAPESARSVPLAFGMSAIVPGLGQAYNKDWLGLAIFVAVEAALVTGWAVWRSNGNQGVDEYEQYANVKWSPRQYAMWLNSYSGYPGPDVEMPGLSDEEFMNPDAWSAADRAEANAFFENIRNAERQSIYLETGASFSHVLPNFGEQQYYELIGKYFQYAPGWLDYSGMPDEDPRDVMPDDADFYFYAGIHADANDELRRSQTAGALVIVNHFAAAVQAAVVARMHNRRIQPSLGFRQDVSGHIVPEARMAVRF